MKKPFNITFNAANYKNEEDAFQDVATVLRILTKNNYICSFEYEDCGIYVLQFDYQDDVLCKFKLCWVPEESYAESNSIEGEETD